MIENILLNLFNYNNIPDISDNKFMLPIELLEDKIYINDSIKQDLELENNYKDIQDNINKIKKENDKDKLDKENDKEDNIYDISLNNKISIYKYVFNPSTELEEKQLNKWSNYYTNNKDFLLDTQSLLLTYDKCYNKLDNSLYDISCDNLYKDFIQNAKDKYFIDKYQYIDLPYFNKYNNNEYVLLALSFNNLFNPLLTLFIPIIFLLLPFVIIKLQNQKITLEEYIIYLKLIFKNHIIGKVLNGFSETNLSNKIYILFSLLFYIYQIYQNYNLCIKFYKNIKDINLHLNNIQFYIENSIDKFKNLLLYTCKLSTYKKFNDMIYDNINVLQKFLDKLKKVSIYKLSINKITELGNIMKCFYILNTDKDLVESLYYSFDLNTYINNITNLKENIKNKNISFCNYIDKNSEKSTKIINQYYAPLLNTNNTNGKIIKNSINFDKNIIISGPNASGKTTILKSSIFNILLSQQLGCGFFESANLKIYDSIHCYLNIPDTSNRDSLFQAEARRCKDIITLISETSDKNHFCIFDELYSGTNPDEAVKSGYHFIKYINENKHVNFLLTTHYVNLCKKLKLLNLSNYKMSVKTTNNDFKYNYKLIKGISKIKGGIKVLKDLKYPEQILENIHLKI